MYFWKCWYSTRWIVAIYLLIVAVVTGVALHFAPVHVNDLLTMMTVWRVTTVCVTLTSLAAWILGSIGLSRDIAEGSGAYLLSQPRSIAFFVWNDAAIALGELLLFVVLPISLFLAALSLHVIQFDGHTILVNRAAANAHLSASQIAPIILSSFIFAGLVYSVSYLFTALLRRTGLSIFLSAAFYMVYSTLVPLAPEWPAPYRWLFPTWHLSPFNQPYAIGMNGEMLTALALRAVAIVLLIFVAQLVLQKIEIRA